MNLASIALSSVLLCSFAAAQELQWARNPASSRWYGIQRVPTDWRTAKGVAQGQGGFLATVRSGAENAWIQSTFTGFNPDGYWLGLNDEATEGVFVWASGDPSTYTNWMPGQPNNTSIQGGVGIVPSSSWRWDDLQTTATITPLVELETVPGAGFTLPIRLNVQSSPGFVAIGDVSGDGKGDVVVSNAGSSSLSILRGNGDGTFAAATHLSTPAAPRTVVVRDLDGDLDLDLVVACGDAAQVRVLYNDGAGAFPTNTTLSLPGRGHGLACADLDADGDLDLVATTIETLDRVVVFKNLTGTTFSGASIYPAGSRPQHVTARDLDADADVDLVVSNHDSDDVAIYRNQGDGTFTTGPLLARGNGPGLVAVADLDFDGRVDLAIPCRLDNHVRIWWGAAGGAFTVGPPLVAGIEPVACITADMDGDTRDDLVVSSLATDTASVYYARGGGFLDGPKDLFVGDGPTHLASGRLDQDARADLAFTANVASQAIVLLKLSRDCNGNGVDDPRDIALGTSDDCNDNAVPDECDLEPGEPFDCDANGVIDSCEIATTPALDLDDDEVLDECESAGNGFCFGDSTGAACPCDPGQAGAPGSGCSNSFGTSALLVAVGNPDVSADSVSLRATGVLPNAVGLFFQGNNQQLGGLGTAFGDGLLCVNTSIKRLGIRNAANGAMAYGRDVPTDVPISVIGQVPAAGATRYYQLWYRDAASFCSPLTYNTSNGVRIVWLP